MIKKIFILISLFIITIFSFDISFSDSSNCKYTKGESVLGTLKKCVGNGKSDLVQTDYELKVDDGLKKEITGWTTKIATFLALGAIFSIVFGSLKMVLSRGEEEAIKKAKDIIKWGMIGLLGVVSAGFIISVVVKLVYSVGSI